MTDYYLYDGDNITISTETVVDNFYYCGGDIRVHRNAQFIVNGNYYFSPTSSIMAIEHIADCFTNRLALECGTNSTLEGFYVYDKYPGNKALFFPCFIVDVPENKAEEGEAFFGNESMQRTTIILDLAFKKEKQISVSGSDLSKECLADYYLFEVNRILNKINYISDYINIDKVEINGSVQVPHFENQSLYGFSMDIDVSFYVQLNE